MKANYFIIILFFCTINSLSQNDNSASYSLDLTSGFSLPNGDFKKISENGFNTGFVVNKKYCNNISLGLGANYTSLEINNNLAFSNKRWNNISVFAGPQYNLGTSDFSIQLYGRLGLSFIDVPEISTFYQQTNILTTNFDEANTTALNTRLGITIGTKICNGLNAFISSEYSTSLSGEINYKTRDISSAIDATGNIDPDFANTINFNNESFSFSTFNINLGLRIDIGYKNKRCDGIDYSNNNSRATDYNSSRSNKSYNAGNIIDNNNDTINRATDYNSSRSNKSYNAANVLDNNNDTINRATDYNSSRSNKADGINQDNSLCPPGYSWNQNKQECELKTRATDYNSSRSNKADGINQDNSLCPPGYTWNQNKQECELKTRATDYNSSRSNKADGINQDNSLCPPGYTWNQNKQECELNTRATDYNSSRSNKSEKSGIHNNDTEVSKIINANITSINLIKRVMFGRLIVESPSSRNFSLITNDSKKITGILNTTITQKQLNRITKVTLLKRIIKYKSGKERNEYEILNISN